MTIRKIFATIFVLGLMSVPAHAEGWFSGWWLKKKPAQEAPAQPAKPFSFAPAAKKEPPIKTSLGDLDPALLRIDGQRPVTKEDLMKVSLVLRAPILNGALEMRKEKAARLAAEKAGKPVPKPSAAKAPPVPRQDPGGLYIDPAAPKNPPKVFKDF